MNKPLPFNRRHCCDTVAALSRVIVLCLLCGCVTTAMAQLPVEFRYKGQSLANGATVTITTAEEDPFTGGAKFETNPGPGNQGLILQNLSGADISTASATIEITKKTIQPSLVQWCMGSDCVPLNTDTYQKQFTVNKDGYVRVEFDALATQYGELEATLSCMVNLRQVSVKIRFVHADPNASPQIWWSYVNTDPQNFSCIGVGAADTYNCAVLYTASTPMLKGATISGVRFYLLDKTNISNVSVWFAKSLPASADKADIAKIDVPQSQLADLLNDNRPVEVTLPTPYVMGTANIYVGYSFTVNAIMSNADNNPIVVGDKPATGVRACYLRTAKAVPAWSDNTSSYGALSTQLLLANPTMPQHSADVAAIDQRTVGVTGQVATANAKAIDQGLSPIYNIDYVVTVGGTAQPSCHYELPQAVNSPNTAFTLPVQFTMPDTPCTSDISVAITHVNGQANPSTQTAAGRIVSVSQTGHHRSVVEEYTGTWCMHCPRGFVGLQNLATEFGDDAITIAAHTNDPMAINAYQDEAINPGSFPSCSIDRTIDCDPYLGYAYSSHYGANVPFAAQLAKPTEADLTLTAGWTAEGTIGYTASTTFYTNATEAPYALALVLTADGLTGTTSDWAQVNAASGNNTYPDADMDWWRQQPDPATGVVYNHVAIWADGLVKGVSGSIQMPIAAGQQQQFSGTINATGNKLIQDPEKLHLIAMLLDTQSGQVVNAAKAPVASATGIGQTANSPSSDAPWYDLQGRRIAAPTLPGLYIQNGKKVIIK